MTQEINDAEKEQKAPASKGLIIAGWFFAFAICFIGAVIGHIIQNNGAYDESSRQQGKAIRYTSYVVFVISLIIINSQK